MSEHQQFLAERDQLDFYIQKGYRISGVTEHFNGATVLFQHPNGKESESVLVGTANARKYFSSLLMKQNQSTQ